MPDTILSRCEAKGLRLTEQGRYADMADGHGLDDIQYDDYDD